MAKYMFIYRDPQAAAAHAPSPAEIQAALAQWGAWIGKFRESGNVVDGGDGLKPDGRLLRPGGVISDGPFAEAKEILGGYSVISADSYDHAVKIARECPCLLHGGSIEIREFAGYTS